jgi:hypothetical protein
MSMVQAWVMQSGSATGNVSYKTASARKERSVIGWRTARTVFFLVAFALLFSGFTMMRSFASEEDVQPAGATELVVNVDSGDTLWALAADVKRPSLDTREAVHRIMKRNQLSSVSLKVGDSLVIPDSVLP